MIKNNNQFDVIFAMTSETIGREKPGTKIHYFDSDADEIVGEDGLSKYPYTPGGSGGGGGKQFVGTVHDGGTFPTHRFNGDPLQESDYVSAVAPFPATVNPGGVVFNSIRDKAYYNGSSWQIDPGVVQDTSETPVKNKEVESISKSKTKQSDINAENVEAINNKIDKIDGTISLEHAVIKKADNTYSLMQINSANNAANAIVRRDNDKQINVPLTPAGDDDATSKKYVDDNLSAKVDRQVTEDSGAKSTIDNQKGQHGAVLQSEFGDTIVSFNTADENGEDGILAQVYAKTKSTNQGVRLNVKKNGIYYSKGTSATTAAGEEIATLDDCGGGEPELYVKKAEVNNNLIKFTDQDDTETIYEPSIPTASYDYTMKQNSAGKWGTYVGGGQERSATPLSVACLNDDEGIFKGAGGVFPVDIFLFANKQSAMEVDDVAVVKTTINGTLHVNDNVEVKKYEFPAYSMSFNGVKVNNYFGGVYTYLLDTPYGIALYTDGVLTSTDTITCDIQLTRYPMVMKYIDADYIEKDGSSIKEVDNVLQVGVSAVAGNGIVKKSDGLWCQSGGGGSANFDYTMKQDSTTGLWSTSVDGGIETITEEQQIYEGGSGTYYAAGSFEWLGDTACYAFGMSAEAQEAWQVGNTVTYEITYKGDTYARTDLIQSGIIAGQKGAIVKIDCHEGETLTMTYFGISPVGFCVVSNKQLEASTPISLSQMTVKTTVTKTHKINNDFFNYNPNMLMLNGDKQLEPIIKVGTWDEKTSLVGLRGNTMYDFTTGAFKVDGVDWNSLSQIVSYTVPLTIQLKGYFKKPSGGGVTVDEKNGILVQSGSEYVWTRPAGSTCAITKIIFYDDSSGRYGVVYYDTTKMDASTIGYFELVLEGWRYDQTIHQLPSQYINQAQLGIPITIDGTLLDDGTVIIPITWEEIEWGNFMNLKLACGEVNHFSFFQLVDKTDPNTAKFNRTTLSDDGTTMIYEQVVGNKDNRWTYTKKQVSVS